MDNDNKGVAHMTLHVYLQDLIGREFSLDVWGR